MTCETYTALAACARRRIESEWSCSNSERDLLMLITELSFDLAQTWAMIPSLADFAAVLGVHKSTICRTLRSARQKGFLLVLMRRDETLYSVCTETRGTPHEIEDDHAAKTKTRLVEMNKTRRAGTADADGQQRLPGVLPSEEVEAPARAFAAMVESSFAEATENKDKEPKSVPCETIPAPTTRTNVGVDDDDETDAEFHARLERMTRSMEKARGDVPATQSSPPSIPPSRQECQSHAAKMDKLCRGLKGTTLHAMERLREEFASAGKLQEASFFKWSAVWKNRVLGRDINLPGINHNHCLEVAGEHKNLRLTTGGAREPGAWMYRALQELVNAEVVE